MTVETASLQKFNLSTQVNITDYILLNSKGFFCKIMLQ